ncbi:MAG: hypothetical protein KC417_01385 [Myxococcales bacterium]|nr:hypothetical protein [Myxococcales bacterium]
MIGVPPDDVRAWARLRATRLLLTVALGGGLALALSSPLLGITGPESALLLGLLLPPFVAAAVAARIHALRATASAASPAPLPWRGGLGIALTAVVVPTAVLALNGFRVRNCAPLEGLAFMFVGPFLGASLAAALALPVTAAIRSQRWGMAAAVAAPMAVVALGLLDLYRTPAVFAYNHIAGYYPGTLYDELVTLGDTYLLFRVLTVVLLAAVLLATASLWDGSRARLCGHRLRRRPILFVVACALGAAFTFATVHAAELGHRSSSEFIAKELGRRVYGRRCVVDLPRELGPRDRTRIVDDCDFRVEQVEATLGVRQPRRVHAFIFRSTAEKKRLMGAGSTYIAKPWRNEVYLQASGFPHPVLAHELTHVIAGNLARGPFRIAATVGGLWPNPGLIEGTAVAIAWDVRDGMTPHQWARTMLELDVAPPLTQVFGLGFLGNASSRSYTAAGSFLRFIADTRGMATVRRAYVLGDVEAATGTPLTALEHEWHTFLATVPVDDGAMGLARIRFERAGIFSAVCPHQLAVLEGQLGGDLGAHDDRGAVATCEKILSFDPSNTNARALYATSLAGMGRITEAEGVLKALEGPPPAPTPLLQSVREKLADEACRPGDRVRAHAAYGALLEVPMTDDAARAIEVKRDATANEGEATDIVFDILVGSSAAQAPPQVVVERALRLGAIRADGLGPYLASRQLLAGGRADLALPYLNDALRRALPSARLAKEAERIRCVALEDLARWDDAAQCFDALRHRPDTTHGDSVVIDDWRARIAWESRRHGGTTSLR